MKSPSNVPERQLIIGLPDSGKSESWVQTAAHYRATNSPGHFYVINGDIPSTVERCNERWDDWQSNISFVNVSDWSTLSLESEAIRLQAKAGDWIVVDSGEKPWIWIRDEWDYQQAKAKGTLPAPGDVFASIAEDDSPGRWDKINGAYQRWIMPLLDPARNPAHLMFTNPSQPIVVEGMFSDDKSVIAELGRFGVRPAGQKHLAHQFHTVLWAQHTRQGYTLTTMKDRSREPMDGTVITPTMSFPIAYLMGVAGWGD